MRFCWVCCVLVALVFGCHRHDNSQGSGASADTSSGGSGKGASEINNDTTLLNSTDQLDKPTTPEELGGSKADLEITRKIRHAIRNDPELSESAKTIKIVTVNGKVTLKGTVTSLNEQRALAGVARREAGIGA